MGAPPQEVLDHLVYQVVVGSRAFGLATDTSDFDVHAIYVEPPSWTLGFTNPSSMSFRNIDGNRDTTYRTAAHFIQRLLSGSPVDVELLYVGDELVEHTSSFFSQLRASRQDFLTEALSDTVRRQIKSTCVDHARNALNGCVRDTPEVRSRVCHTIRLARMLIRAHRIGDIDLVSDDKEELLAVKSGAMTLDQAMLLANAAHDGLLLARSSHALPRIDSGKWIGETVAFITRYWREGGSA